MAELLEQRVGESVDLRSRRGVVAVELERGRRKQLERKSLTEGNRAQSVKLAMHRDQIKLTQGKDDAKAAYHQGQVDLLTPLVKAYGSEEAYRLCGLAIQVYGGAGFLKDWPVEQYARDSKIFSIYEGTTHIQAMDLVGRKLGQNGGSNFQSFMGDVTAFIDTNRNHPVFAKEVATLSAATEAVMQVAMGMLGWSQSDKFTLVPLNANRFLDMMSRLAVGWLSLDAGVKAEAASAKLPAGHADKAFYEGKRASALWYGRNVLPQIETMARMAQAEDSSPVEISDAAFRSAV